MSAPDDKLAKPTPFAAILKQAAAAPKNTGTVGRYEKRLTGGTGNVVVADVSASMNEWSGGVRRIDVLRRSLAQVWADAPRGVPLLLVAFSSTPLVIAGPDDLPEPSGGTALHSALEAAGRYTPARTVVISDGEPDSEDAALDAADKITGAIDVIYVGDDKNRRAVAFLRKLARKGCGQYGAVNLSSGPAVLGPKIRGLLGA